MRITCQGIDAFTAHLGPPATVYGGTVYVDRTRRPVNGDDRNATVWEVTIHATAVLDYPDGGQALLLCGVVCGLDRETDGEEDGTVEYQAKREDLQAYCDELGLKVMPGVVDM